MKKQIFAALRALGIGVLTLPVYLLLARYTDLSAVACILLSLLAVVILGSAFYAFAFRRSSTEDEKLTHSLGQIMLEIVIKMPLPMVICDTNGKIIWRNRAFAALTAGLASVMGANLYAMFGVSEEEVDADETDIAFMGKQYRLHTIPFKTDEKNYRFLTLSDRTEINDLAAAVENERSVVGIVMIDNIDELSRTGQDQYRSEINKVLDILHDFADSYGAILREYDRNKYLFLLSHAAYEDIRQKEFPILDRVRSVRVGELGISLTVSIGITDRGDTLADREANAREALGIALSRGGDQAVSEKGDDMQYFGGTTRPMQKRSRVASKVRSGELVARISAAPAVLVMGHVAADADCLGAAVGIIRLAKHCGVPGYMIVDPEDRNTKNFMAHFASLADYRDVFVTESEAQELITSDTLLIVVDVNNPEIMLSTAIAYTVQNALIIDHHRKIGTGSREWLAEYIEPSVSSASELVAEILEQTVGEGKILKEEADALLAGIVLDTAQFTKSTGTRTFNAAIFLRSAGANVYEAANGLRSDYDLFCKQSKILADTVIYKDRFAIAKDESDSVMDDRVAAAKAAETLLTIRGVEAAFTLLRIGDRTYISARSNSQISVQLILEKLGGGGHFDSAGASTSDPMLTALRQLKGAINEYLDEQNKK